MNKIYCLRELKWSFKNDILSTNIIGLSDIPDHSTFYIRLKEIESTIFYQIYKMLVLLLKSNIRISSIDSTALRSSRFDSQAKSGKSTRLGWYKGYKLHLVTSFDLVPLALEFTTANVYDSVKLFKLCEKMSINLITDINLSKAKSYSSIKNEYRVKNLLYLQSPIGQNIYKKRLSIERLFSILKMSYGLENPRLYGFNKYKSRVMWAILLYLVEKLLDKEKGLNAISFLGINRD